jgi:hypothetical protein
MLLFTLLNATVFLSSGRVSKDDAFINQASDCLYLEPENVTFAQDTWAVSTRLSVPQSGPCFFVFQLNGTSPPPPACLSQNVTAGFDRPGYDYESTPTPTTWQACEAACCNAAQCVSWVWVPKAPGPYMGCTDTTQPCCYLKTAAPAPIPSSIPGWHSTDCH